MLLLIMSLNLKPVVYNTTWMKLMIKLMSLKVKLLN